MKLKSLLPLALLVFCSSAALSQKPADGDYTYKVAFAEWQGRSQNCTVLVRIKGDSIQVIHNGGGLSGKKGEVIDSGMIMKHSRTGKWIIAHDKKDRNAKTIGGCTDGPAVIDFDRKVFWLC